MDVVAVVFAAVAVAFAAVYVGALLAIVRPDHRNPCTRFFVDRIERHARHR